jgi:hypothetical protein
MLSQRTRTVAANNFCTDRGIAVRAQISDRLILKGLHPGVHNRVGVITGVKHVDGTPPYRVRWLDDGHEAFVFPGPEAHVEPPAVAHAEAIKPAV